MTLTQKTPFWKSAFAVFLAALLLRLIFAWGGLTSGDDRFARPDTDSYLAPAHSLVCSGTYCGVDGKPTAHRTPGLPILLAVLSYFGQRTFFSFVLLFMGSLTVFPVYALCRKFAPPGASAAATMLFA